MSVLFLFPDLCYRQQVSLDGDQTVEVEILDVSELPNVSPKFHFLFLYLTPLLFFLLSVPRPAPDPPAPVLGRLRRHLLRDGPRLIPRGQGRAGRDGIAESAGGDPGAPHGKQNGFVPFKKGNLATLYGNSFNFISPFIVCVLSFSFFLKSPFEIFKGKERK